MLTRTTTRRSAFVPTLALVAMLLVALAGSARAAQHRVSAGSGQSVAGPHLGRHAAVVPPASHDHGPWHLDLGSTPPDDDVTPGATFSTVVERADTSGVSHESVAAVGRAPPAL